MKFRNETIENLKDELEPILQKYHLFGHISDFNGSEALCLIMSESKEEISQIQRVYMTKW